MMTPGFLGLPMIDGKIALGASSPENPALTIPDPLSITQVCYSSAIWFTLEDISLINNL